MDKALLIINTIAIVIIPIAAVLIAQKLQDRAAKRKDKIEIFKTLVSTNVYGWGSHYRAFEALNSIAVIFADNKKVIEAYNGYLSACNIDSEKITEAQRDAVKTAKIKLLEEMSKELGYKSEWHVFTKTYMPQGIAEDMERRKQYEYGQLAFANMASTVKEIIPNFIPQQKSVQPQEVSTEK